MWPAPRPAIRASAGWPRRASRLPPSSVGARAPERSVRRTGSGVSSPLRRGGRAFPTGRPLRGRVMSPGAGARVLAGVEWRLTRRHAARRCAACAPPPLIASAFASLLPGREPGVGRGRIAGWRARPACGRGCVARRASRAVSRWRRAAWLTRIPPGARAGHDGGPGPRRYPGPAADPDSAAMPQVARAMASAHVLLRFAPPPVGRESRLLPGVVVADRPLARTRHRDSRPKRQPPPCPRAGSTHILGGRENVPRRARGAMLRPARGLVWSRHRSTGRDAWPPGGRRTGSRATGRRPAGGA